MAENLWPAFDEIEVRTPFAILQEQAEFFSKNNSLLVGNVDRSTREEIFINILQIIAPSLNEYTFNVVNVTHKITLYPCTLYMPWADHREVADSEKKLIEHLREILGSEYIKKVVSALRAQVK